TLLHVAKMDVEIFAARRSPRLRHVLSEDLARSNAFHEYCAEVSDQGSDKVVWLECVGGADCCCFLAQRAKHAADDLCLAVEIHETLLNETREFQVAIQFEMLLGFERGLGRAA